jgi:hypothetical protein
MNGSVGRACLLAVVLLIPNLALAQCPATDPDALTYEVAETMLIRGGGAGRRESTATIVGSVRQGTPVCPASLGMDPCPVTIIASDVIRLDTGEGPFHGDFYILRQDAPDSIDGAEAIVIHGSIRGTIDLTPVLVSHLPLVNLTGGSLQGRGAKETPVANQIFRADFDGVFRLPFLGPEGPSYLCPGVIQPLASNEMSLGVPTVRLEITFQ